MRPISKKNRELGEDVNAKKLYLFAMLILVLIYIAAGIPLLIIDQQVGRAWFGLGAIVVVIAGMFLFSILDSTRD